MAVTLQIPHWQFFHKGQLARSTISIRTRNKPIWNNVKLSTVRWCWRRLKDLQNFLKNIHFNIWQRVIEWGRGYLSLPHSPPLCLFLTGHNSISKRWLLCQGAANYRKNIHYIVIERLWICNHYHQYRVIAMSCGFHENASYSMLCLNLTVTVSFLVYSEHVPHELLVRE